MSDLTENVPNGDTYKIQLAAGPAWTEFTSDPAISESETRIKEIAENFDRRDPNQQDIAERMETMRLAAVTISAIAPALRSAADDFHSALAELRTAMKIALESSEAPVIVEIKNTRIAIRESADSSPISPDEIAVTIHNTMSHSRFIQVVELPFGGKSYELTQRLVGHIAPLSDISQIRIELMDDGSGNGREERPRPELTPEQKALIVLDIVTDDNGNLIGKEDASGVMMVTQEDVDRARAELHERLGPPETKITPKGPVEVWIISTDPKSNVTFRSFSESGGATIDFNAVPGVPIKRWHISR
ncbi:hypothetical protein GV791_18010 [Nocardia cyriacigeorgica]|uniref:Uncharacterized protein n=1 Tax=Nocardia cyriacigeorgica TaxID=135487 RepID=A0A6P1CPL3_9NOCA|nr:hypothetical protein [Nocardia cyriacigeorgica]NEW34438.1 hypothetical protein [Nocardia cyriacigeorgica]